MATPRVRLLSQATLSANGVPGLAPSLIRFGKSIRARRAARPDPGHDSSRSARGTDVDGDLDGVPALAQALLQSEEVRSCVARQWFRYAFGHEATSAADSCTVSALAGELERTHGDLKRVVRATVEQQLFQNQRAEEAAP
jgi:hypothetical protein